MRESPVPVHMGSQRSLTREAGEILITSAWFPPGARLEPHIHERATFAVMLDGGFDLVFTSAAIRHRRRECSPGVVFTEPPCEKHQNDIGTSSARVVVLQPDPTRDDLTRGTRGILDQICHFRHGEILFAARRLARELETWDDVSPLGAAGLALEILALGSRSSAQRSAFFDRPTWLRRVEGSSTRTSVSESVSPTSPPRPASRRTPSRASSVEPIARRWGSTCDVCGWSGSRISWLEPTRRSRRWPSVRDSPSSPTSPEPSSVTPGSHRPDTVGRADIHRRPDFCKETR